nr:MAG TPA: hypothetical protein [Caudoviricetes sp.]
MPYASLVLVKFLRANSTRTLQIHSCNSGVIA